MRTLPLVLLGWVLMAGPTRAVPGPNQGGTLVAHDTGLTYTTGRFSYPSSIPSCKAVDNSLPLGLTDSSAYVWKVYAMFPPESHPRLKELSFGAEFSDGVIVIAGGVPDPAADYERAELGWPFDRISRHPGVAISFGATQTTRIVECYWLAGYADGSAPAVWRLAPHPFQNLVFVDDAIPPRGDAIAALGSLGFGQPGETPCPGEESVGACCYDLGTCRLTTLEECEEELCGQWAGASVPCQARSSWCPPGGACCQPDGSCEVTLARHCDGHDWFLGGCCDPNPCPPPSACCVGTRCMILGYVDCLDAPGRFHRGEECAPDPWDNPCYVAPHIETTWGRLKKVFR